MQSANKETRQITEQIQPTNYKITTRMLRIKSVGPTGGWGWGWGGGAPLGKICRKLQLWSLCIFEKMGASPPPPVWRPV